MKILIADTLESSAIEILKEKNFEVDYKPGLTEEQIISCVKDYDGILVRSATKITSNIINAADKLKVIGRAGVGLDNVDVKAAKSKNIAVFNVPDGNTITTSEHTIALLLSLSKNIPQADTSLRNKKWEKSKFINCELYDKVLGIIGLGRIGKYVANIAKSFKMKVIAFDPFVAEENSIEMVKLDDLLSKSDFITIHTSLNEQTKYLIAEAEFEKMKNGVKIINCARGGIIKESALLEAIKKGKVAGCALDVFEKEPPLFDNPLLSLPQVIFTPHLGASTSEAQKRNAVEIAEKIASFLKGESK
ncbi:MAG: hydroxyacid dehydrogenase [bacterium]